MVSVMSNEDVTAEDLERLSAQEQRDLSEQLSQWQASQELTSVNNSGW
jgi:hypothetical protein